jgi:hypothetical protein
MKNPLCPKIEGKLFVLGFCRVIGLLSGSYLFRKENNQESSKSKNVQVSISEKLVCYLLNIKMETFNLQKAVILKNLFHGRIVNVNSDEFTLKSLTISVKEKNVGLQDIFLLKQKIHKKLFNNTQEYQGKNLKLN